jgi:cysteine synthase
MSEYMSNPVEELYAEIDALRAENERLQRQLVASQELVNALDALLVCYRAGGTMTGIGKVVDRVKAARQAAVDAAREERG